MAGLGKARQGKARQGEFLILEIHAAGQGGARQGMAWLGKARQGEFLKMENRIGDWLQTYTDRQFWPLDPRPEEVFIEDIAGALSKICRYGGHCRRFYSVAEHSVLVSLHVPPQFALWGLLHDAAEAYIGDMVRPLKRDMPEFQAVEARLMAVIASVFGLPLNEPAIVKEIDDRILMREKELLRGPSPAAWSVKIEPLNCHLYLWNYRQAERAFLRRFKELTK